MNVRHFPAVVLNVYKTVLVAVDIHPGISVDKDFYDLPVRNFHNTAAPDENEPTYGVVD